MLRVKKPRDLGAGLLFIAFGIVGLWFGRNYAIGTVARMGPGYFPAMLSWLLIALGGTIGARAFVLEGPRIDTIRWRAILAVLSGVALFALTIQRVGAAIGVVLVVLVAALGTRESRWKEVIPLAIFVSAFCVVVFIFALKQPLPLWGE